MQVRMRSSSRSYWTCIIDGDCIGSLRATGVVKLIQIMPSMELWTKVTWGLKQLVMGIQPFPPFTYHGLMEFLVLVEDKPETLGDQPLEWQHTVNQLIFYLLIKPVVHQDLPNTLADRMPLE